jgi:hypothetical protein
VRLLRNGVVVNPIHYTVTQGSTVVTLKESYLKTLANGTHTFRKEFTEGYADLTLRVNVRDNDNIPVPQTGDSNNMMGWILMLMVSVLGVVCTLGRGTVPYPFHLHDRR